MSIGFYTRALIGEVYERYSTLLLAYSFQRNQIMYYYDRNFLNEIRFELILYTLKFLIIRIINFNWNGMA